MTLISISTRPRAFFKTSRGRWMPFFHFAYPVLVKSARYCLKGVLKCLEVFLTDIQEVHDGRFTILFDRRQLCEKESNDKPIPSYILHRTPETPSGLIPNRINFEFFGITLFTKNIQVDIVMTHNFELSSESLEFHWSLIKLLEKTVARGQLLTTNYWGLLWLTIFLSITSSLIQEDGHYIRVLNRLLHEHHVSQTGDPFHIW